MRSVFSFPAPEGKLKKGVMIHGITMAKYLNDIGQNVKIYVCEKCGSFIKKYVLLNNKSPNVLYCDVCKDGDRLKYIFVPYCFNVLVRDLIDI